MLMSIFQAVYDNNYYNFSLDFFNNNEFETSDFENTENTHELDPEKYLLFILYYIINNNNDLKDYNDVYDSPPNINYDKLDYDWHHVEQKIFTIDDILNKMN